MDIMDISGSGDVDDVSCHTNDVLCVAGEYYAYKKRLATEHDVSIESAPHVYDFFVAVVFRFCFYFPPRPLLIIRPEILIYRVCCSLYIYIYAYI